MREEWTTRENVEKTIYVHMEGGERLPCVIVLREENADEMPHHNAYAHMHAT